MNIFHDNHDDDSQSGTEVTDVHETASTAASTTESGTTYLTVSCCGFCSITRFLQFIDSKTYRSGDTRECRTKKVTVAFMSFALCIATLLINAAALAGGIAPTNGSLISIYAYGAICLGVFIAIMKTGSERLTDIVGHVQLFLMSCILFNTAIAHGVQVHKEDGTILNQSIFILPPVIPALAAFIYRSKNATLVWGAMPSIILWTIFGLKGARQGEDDYFATLVNLTAMSITTFLNTICLAYFGAASVSLVERAADAKSKMRQALRDAIIERNANAAKSRFVAVMSHEIRNPLQAVLLQLEMLETTTLSLQQMDYVKGIGRASQVLLTIVNDVLDVTKIESGVIALESAEFNMREACEFTLQTVAPAAARKDIALFLSFPSDLSPWVRGDVTRVRQVLHNLLGNALKFTMDGEVEMVVSRDAGLRPSSEGPAYEWTVSVRDTGIGINEEGQQKLFREFSQVDESTTREYGGTGLGLFICKQLSELMGGNVSVESEMGVGSTFHVSFVLEESTTQAKHEDRTPPVAIASTTVTWNCFMYGRNRAFVESTCAYLRYFFESAKDAHIRGLNNASTVVSTMRASLAQLKGSDDARIILLVDRYAEESYQEQEMARELLKLAEAHPGKFVPVLVAFDPPATVRQQYIDEGWRYLVQKPVMLANLCTTLADSLDEDNPGNIDVPTSNSFRPSKSKATQATRPQGTKATAGHHTLTRGKRHEPFNDDDAAAVSGTSAPLVMVVDDFQLVRDLVQKVIASLGYRTHVAANGAEALEAIKSDYSAYSMVMMDCEMPVMDGFAATQAIRAFEQSKAVPESLRLPICAMTANAMREDVAKCLRIGMDDFLSKPVKRDDLKSKLQQRNRRVAQTDEGEYVLVHQDSNVEALSKKGSSRSKRRKAKAKQPGDPGDTRTAATPPLIPEGP
jgi:signal transduction histidine kinase/CheY-like chemotaxis protein